MRYDDRGSRTGLSALLLLVPFLLVGCDGFGSSVTGVDADAATVTGVVAQSAPSQAMGSEPMATSGSASASTVVIGEIGAGGGFNAVAEASVNAQGEYRIEGVPANRTDLTVIARSDSEAEVGRVVLHEETRARAEHRAQPITPSTTLHARVWAQTRASASGSSIGAAELSLFLEGEAATDSWTPSENRVNTLAQAAIQAEAAISAVLARLESTMNARARSELMAKFAAERDQARAAGAARVGTQATFVSSSMDALLSAGVRAEALALAYAAGATAWAESTQQAGAQLHSEVVRNALLVNVEARKRAAATAETDGIGVKSAVVSSLAELEASIRGATTVSAIANAMAEHRAGLGTKLASSIASGLPGMIEEDSASVTAQMHAIVEAANYSARVDGAASASAKAEAASQTRAEVLAKVSALLETLPSSAAASASVEALVELFLAAGAGAKV